MHRPRLQARSSILSCSGDRRAGSPEGARSAGSELGRVSLAALAAAAAVGPVSIAIDASGISFQLYHGGIMKKMCGQKLDHGVLLVGYGTDNVTDFWLVKNSWSSSWGEDGYFRCIYPPRLHVTRVCSVLSENTCIVPSVSHYFQAQKKTFCNARFQDCERSGSLRHRARCGACHHLQSLKK